MPIARSTDAPTPSSPSCDADGRPLADTDVVVAQERHAFLFGNIGFDFIALANGRASAEPPRSAASADRTALADLWFDVFNSATLPFYWGTLRARAWPPGHGAAAHAARWFADRGVVVKGHPLAWHTVGAPWLLDLTHDEIADAAGRPDPPRRGRLRRASSTPGT